MATPTIQDDLTRAEFAAYLQTGTRENLWRGRQAVYLADRRQRLDDLYQNEFLHDSQLLQRPWTNDPKTNYPYPFGAYNPMTRSIPMSERGKYPLQDLGDYLHGTADTAQLTRWRATFEDPKFDKVTRSAEWENDLYQPVPGSGIEALEQAFPCLKRSVLEFEKDLDSTIITIYHAYQLFTHLRPLRRFADMRNPEVYVEPVADGSNLCDPNLYPSVPNGSNLPPNLLTPPSNIDPLKNHKLMATWVLHRAWIRSLHYRSMETGGNAIGLDHLKQIYWYGYLLYSDELENVAPHAPNANQANNENFRSIYKLLDRLEESLEDLGSLVRESPNLHVPLSRARLGALVKKHIEDKLTRDDCDHWRLFSTLLESSQLFNRAMDELHVEDDLMSKRVVVQDEEYLAMDLIRVYGSIEGAPEALKDKLTGDSAETIHPYQYLMVKISQFGHLRRNLLLLRDWNRKRPWKQLYLVIDTSPDQYHSQLLHIQRFYMHIAELQICFPQPLNQHIPSNEANKYSSLFPIHPVASTAPPAHLADRWDENCIICLSPFAETPGSIVCELKCHHLFHYGCIRGVWDTEDSLRFTCPYCRNSAWVHHLPDIAGIRPEVPEVWDYAEIMNEDGLAAAGPGQLTDAYWNAHEDMLDLSMNWARAQLDPQGNVIQRSAKVEKAWLREWRKANNIMVRNFTENIEGIGMALLKDQDGVDPLRKSAIAFP